MRRGGRLVCSYTCERCVSTSLVNSLRFIASGEKTLKSKPWLNACVTRSMLNYNNNKQKIVKGSSERGESKKEQECATGWVFTRVCVVLSSSLISTSNASLMLWNTGRYQSLNVGRFAETPPLQTRHLPREEACVCACVLNPTTSTQSHTPHPQHQLVSYFPPPPSCLHSFTQPPSPLT